MEVHHHPNVEKKNFKEYLLEGLMIFLAVTMGFIAESLREHMVDKHREKEYMKEIVENLAYDTIRCTVNAVNNIALLKGIDSLRNELKQALAGKINANALYYYTIQYTGGFNRAVFNTTAISELKNSGSLRLIENRKIVNEVSDYYERKISATNSFLPDETELLKKRNELFSLLELDDLVQSFDNISTVTYGNNYQFEKILQHTPALKLRKSNPEDLLYYYDQASLYVISLKNYNFWLGYSKTAAKKLMTDIRNEYDLDKE